MDRESIGNMRVVAAAGFIAICVLAVALLSTAA
jgi:hypothetical protein